MLQFATNWHHPLGFQPNVSQQDFRVRGHPLIAAGIYGNHTVEFAIKTLTNNLLHSQASAATGIIPSNSQSKAPSRRSMMTQELHLTSFGEIFSYHMPREAEFCLLHDAGALFCGPGIPSTKQKSVESK